MAERPRYTAADVPYLLERDATANNAVRARIEQRRLARLHDRHEDDEDLELSHYGHARRGEDLRRVDRGLANDDRESYPPLEHRHNDLGPLEPGRRGRRYYDPPPYDAADEELEYDRRGRRPNRGPPLYDAADDESIYGDERHGGRRRHGFGNDRLPIHARDMGMDDFDEGSFRDISIGPRNPDSQHRLRASRDMDLDYVSDLGSRVRRGLEPRLDEYDNDYDMWPHSDRRDSRRTGVRAAERNSTGYRFGDDFEDDDLDDNFREARPPRYRSDLNFWSVDDDVEDGFSGVIRAPRAAETSHRARRTGYRSNLGFQSANDGIEDEFTRVLRAPRVSEMSRGAFLVLLQNELEAEKIRERERQESEVEKRNTEEDFEIDDIGPEPRDRHGQMPRTTVPRPAADSSDDDLEDFPREERDNPIHRPQVGTRQKPTKTPRANTNVNKIRKRNQRIPPSYDSVIPAPQAKPRQKPRTPLRANDKVNKSEGSNHQAPPSYDSVTPAPHLQAEQANDANRPPISAAVSDNATSHPVPATVADTTAKNATEDVTCNQKHAQGPIQDANKGGAARDSTRVIKKSNNLVAPRAAQECSVDSAHASRVEVDDDGHSEGSDSGCDTPDEDSETETSGAGDDNLGGGDVLQSFIRITL